MSMNPVSCNDNVSLVNIMTSLSQGTSPDRRVYYQIIKGASIRGKDKLFDSYGYSYVLNHAANNGITASWACSVKNSTMSCDVIVRQEGSVFRRDRETHIHTPKANEYINIIIRQSLKTKVEQGDTRDFSEIWNEILEEFKIPQSYVDTIWLSNLKRYFAKLKQENGNNFSYSETSAKSDGQSVVRNSVSPVNNINSLDDAFDNGDGDMSLLETIMRLTAHNLPKSTAYDSGNTSLNIESNSFSDNEVQDSKIVKNIFNQLVETVQNFSGDYVNPVTGENALGSEFDLGSNCNLLEPKERTSSGPNNIIELEAQKNITPLKICQTDGKIPSDDDDYDDDDYENEETQIVSQKDEREEVSTYLENGREENTDSSMQTPNQDLQGIHVAFENEKNSSELGCVDRVDDKDERNLNLGTEDEARNEDSENSCEEENLRTSSLNAVIDQREPQVTSLNIHSFSDVFSNEDSTVFEENENLNQQNVLREEECEKTLDTVSENWETEEEQNLNSEGFTDSVSDKPSNNEIPSQQNMSELSLGESSCKYNDRNESSPEMGKEGRENVIEKEMSENFIEKEMSENVIEKEMSENVIEKEISENVIEKEMSENVIEKEMSENVIEKEMSENVIEKEMSENVIENSSAVMEKDFTENKNFHNDKFFDKFVEEKSTSILEGENSGDTQEHASDDSFENKTTGIMVETENSDGQFVNKNSENFTENDANYTLKPEVLSKITVVEESNRENVLNDQSFLPTLRENTENVTEEIVNKEAGTTVREDTENILAKSEEEIKLKETLKIKGIGSTDIKLSPSPDKCSKTDDSSSSFEGKRKIEEEEKSVKRSKSNPEASSELADNLPEEVLNDENSSHSIIIGEAFTINEEQMREFEDISDSETKALKPPVCSTLENIKQELTTDAVNMIYDLGQSEKTDTKENLKRPLEEEKPWDIEGSENRMLGPFSKRSSSGKKSKKPKRSTCFKLVRKKKKKGSEVSKKSPMIRSSTPPMQRSCDTLPAFLQELASIDPSLVVSRERLDEEGNKVRVSCIAFHEIVLDWAFTETLLSSFDNARTLRARFNLNSRLNLLFPENVDGGKGEFHPVQLGPAFPFSMPDGEIKEEEGEEVKLPFPLEQLALLCPSSVGCRETFDGKERSLLQTMSFADEPLEWAFKETFLSSFDDSPILSDLLGLSSSTRKWPDVAEEILANEGINHTFPFACPNSKKHCEGILFHELSISLPPFLLHETLQLPNIPSDLERRLYGERDGLVRLLAIASFYKHASCIPTVRSNRKLSVSHDSLVASFRPLIISQANNFAFVIRETRARLLKGVTCQDQSIISALIRGPMQCRRGLLFSNVHKLEAAVAKDPNNKLQFI